jgi:hypothetical protein
MSAEIQIVLISAFAGGVFALIVAFSGALFRDWLDARRRRIEREEEQEAERAKQIKFYKQALDAAGIKIVPKYDEDGAYAGIDFVKEEELSE